MLQEKYNTEIKDVLKTEFGITNDLALPRLKKVVINVGAAEAKDNQAILDAIVTNLTAISGQKPMVTRAKKSISNFKLVQGQPIGVMVTVRGKRMYAFLEKLFNAVLPKVRDFRGVSNTAFDNSGNYNLGLREQTLFPEVDYKSGEKTRGLQITITTNCKNQKEGRRLLELLGMPFSKA
jgi:large subunit ribosomal protein L5